MIHSIQQFCGEGVVKLDKVFIQYSSDLKKIAEMVQGVTDEVNALGRSMIAEEWESYDKQLCQRKDLRRDWHIVRKDEACVLTSLGTVPYHKTLFKNKHTGEYAYLLDRLMGLGKHVRMTEDAEARMLEEAVQSSYRRGGEGAAISGEAVSKETVMNKIHALQFPEVKPLPEKKAIRYLYIDADEDHVALQYLTEKGDLKKLKGNTVMPKLVYVYEGVTDKNGRNELVNTVYFGGVYEGSSGIGKLWNEVYEYIEASYDVEALEKIYINGDGAAWIKRGAEQLPKARFVLDRFHMHKYIIGATSHLKDSAEDARSEIYRSIHRRKKKQAAEAFGRIIAVTESESRRKAVESSRDYILGNWKGIMQWVRDRNKELECSAEGHVSHIFADRMSSRPLGWSKTGADKMSRLRIYERNGGKMLDLVRYQKEALPKAAGYGEVIYSCEQVLASERRNRQMLGKMADIPVYSIPYPQIKKIAALKNQIWGL